MKYRLKDKKLQAEYDKLHPDFSRRLSHEVMEARKSGIKYVGVFLFPQNSWAVFKLSEIEAITESACKYNEHAWNEFPDVTPPEGVWMRVEWFDTYGNIHLGVAKYVAICDSWRDHVWIGDRDIIHRVFRFRPWED